MYVVWHGKLQCNSRPDRSSVIQPHVYVLLCIGHISPSGSGVFLSVAVLGLHVLLRRRVQKVICVFVCVKVLIVRKSFTSFKSLLNNQFRQISTVK